MVTSTTTTPKRPADITVPELESAQYGTTSSTTSTKRRVTLAPQSSPSSLLERFKQLDPKTIIWTLSGTEEPWNPENRVLMLGKEGSQEQPGDAIQKIFTYVLAETKFENEVFFRKIAVARPIAISDEMIVNLASYTCFMEGEIDCSSSPEFTGKTLSKLSSTSEISSAVFDHCPKLTDKGLSVVCNWIALKSLSLVGGSFITSKGFANITNLKSLTRLDLSFCEIDSKGFEFISKISYLQDLNVDGNPLLDKTCMVFISKIERLLTLGCSSCPQIDDDALEPLKERSVLLSIDFGGCPITDKGLAHFSHLTSLQNLQLYHNPNITGVGLEVFKQMENLKWVDLAGDTSVDTIDGFENASLTRVTLDMTAVGGKALRMLEKKPLQELSLNYCENVTSTQIQRLQKRLPDCKIIF